MSERPLAPELTGDGNGDGRDLEELFAEYVERINAGEEIDPQELIEKHPRLAADLLRELDTYQSVQMVGSGAPTQEFLGTLGDYTLRRQIGRGGMGVVYEAWENSMDRAVALKVLPAGIAADKNATDRFLREAQVAGRLNHEHVVRVYSTGVKEGTPWYSMELVEGETLAQILAKLKDADAETQTPFGPKDDTRYFANLAEAFADVADGLQHAHSKGVTHRDIKPSNLILDQDGRLRILDFGLARLEGQESLTISGDVVGTPLYMSPEQARRKKIPVDHRTDVYSLGATMYEAICGQPPFRGKDHADTLSRIIERDPVEPRKANPRVPQGLETIVLKCLRKNASDRYGTAEALGQDLRRYVRGDPIEARPESGAERLARGLRRNWRRYLAAGGVLLAVLFGTLLLVGYLRQREAERWTLYNELVNQGIVAQDIGLLPEIGEELDGEIVALGLLFRGDLHYRPRAWRDLFHSAISGLEKATQLYPDRPEAWVHLSRGLRALGQRDDASEALARCLERTPDFVPAELLRDYDRRQRPGEKGTDDLPGRTLESHRFSPDSWESSWIRSHNAACNGDWALAAETLSDLRASFRGRPEPFAGFDMELHLRLGRLALFGDESGYFSAAEEFSAVRERMSEHVGPWILLASTYYLTRQDEAAHATLDLARRRLGDGVATILATVHQNYGELERGLALLNSIEDEKERSWALATMGRSLGYSPEERIAACDHALDLGVTDDPSVHHELAWAYCNQRRAGVARNYLERIIRESPEWASELTPELGWMFYYLGDMDTALETFRTYPDRERSRLGIAYSLFRKGELDEALAAFDEALNLYPRHNFAFSGIAMVQEVRGEIQLAIDAWVQDLLLAPGKGGYYRLLRLYSFERRDLFEPCWPTLSRACSRVDKDRANWNALSLVALAEAHRPGGDRDLALEYMQTAVKKFSPVDSEALLYLADVLVACGEKAEAIRTLEKALGLQNRRKSLATDLERLRGSLFPTVVSCASVDAFLSRRSDEESHSVPVDEIVPATPTIRRYLDACFLERSGKVDAARTQLEELIVANGCREEAAVLRLARLRAETDAPLEGLSLIEDLLFMPGNLGLHSVALWCHIASGVYSWKAALMSGRLERMERGHPFLADLEWALAGLSEEGRLRIHCGSSKDYVGSDGGVWSRDRCSDGLTWSGRHVPTIPDDRDETLHLFRRGCVDPYSLTPGYRIPLPDGTYDVDLHFCHAYRMPVELRFDVVIENETMLEDVNLDAVGFGIPLKETRRVQVRDGRLDIVLRPVGNSAATISAIEIRTVGS